MIPVYVTSDLRYQSCHTFPGHNDKKCIETGRLLLKVINRG